MYFQILKLRLRGRDRPPHPSLPKYSRFSGRKGVLHLSEEKNKDVVDLARDFYLLKSRISILEVRYESTKEELTDIKGELKEISKSLKELNAGGLTSIIHEQNQEVIQTLASLITQKMESQDMLWQSTHEQNVLESKVKLKVWHVIGLIIASGFFTLLIDIIRRAFEG